MDFFNHEFDRLRFWFFFMKQKISQKLYGSLVFCHAIFNLIFQKLIFELTAIFQVFSRIFFLSKAAVSLFVLLPL